MYCICMLCITNGKYTCFDRLVPENYNLRLFIIIVGIVGIVDIVG